jgi:hypothetical protein
MTLTPVQRYPTMDYEYRMTTSGIASLAAWACQPHYQHGLGDQCVIMEYLRLQLRTTSRNYAVDGVKLDPSRLFPQSNPLSVNGRVLICYCVVCTTMCNDTSRTWDNMVSVRSTILVHSPYTTLC